MMLHMLMGSIHLSSGNWFKTNLFLYIIIFRSQNLCDSNSILENCCGKNACKTSGKCFSWPCLKLSCVGPLCNICTQTPTVWCWVIRISSHFHGSMKILLPFAKAQTCQLFDTIVKKCLKNVLHCEKSASECLRHTASLYVFFAPTIHVGPCMGLRIRIRGLLPRAPYRLSRN